MIQRSNSRSRNEDCSLGSDNEYHCIHGRNDKNTIAEDKTGSLINKAIVEFTNFDIKLQTNKMGYSIQSISNRWFNTCYQLLLTSAH
jgi:hypothetical protein